MTGPDTSSPNTGFEGPAHFIFFFFFGSGTRVALLPMLDNADQLVLRFRAFPFLTLTICLSAYS